MTEYLHWLIFAAGTLFGAVVLFWLAFDRDDEPYHRKPKRRN